jgi:lycopene beta-cyclase
MRYHYVLVGGGLQNGLLARALAAEQPGARVLIVERDERLGGNHTWSFHPSDVSEAARAWLAPLVAHTWDGHEVWFPDHRRVLAGGYATITSERFDAVVRGGALDLRCGVAVDEVAPGRVRLAGGEEIEADVVVDARGPRAMAGGCGWQTFVGLEVQLARPSAIARPILMDATVPQIGGYRFVYTLPLAPDRLLIEDTYYADTPALDVEVVAERVRAYAAERGLAIAAEVRREHGALPIPWQAPDDERPLEGRAGAWLLRAGYGGGWFHPTTGYSLPVATRLAAFVAARRPEEIDRGFDSFVDEHRRQARFARLLNRMLFRHVAPEDRWRVLSRFYRLPEASIARFYGLETTRVDRLRVLCGRPPRGMSLAARPSEAR